MKFFKKLLSELILGRVNKRLSELEARLWRSEYALLASLKPIDFETNENVGFNDQQYRKKIFRELNSIFKFEKIIETGTFSGNTTGYFSVQTGLPIKSAEISELFFNVAKKRLEKYKNVKLFNMDSVSMLVESASEAESSRKKTFFYLDAHWYDNLPLEEEINVICNGFSDFVIMIDDFKVESDSGYAFDDYGVGKSLSLECFGKLFNDNGLDIYFPACKSSNETGNRTGSVILIRKDRKDNGASKLTTLWKYS